MPYLLCVVLPRLFGHTFRTGQGVHHSGLWLHVAPPISEPRHVSVQWNPYFSNLLITRTLETLFPFPQSNTVTLSRFLKLPYYLNKVLFLLNVQKNLDSTVISLLLFVLARLWCFKRSELFILSIIFCRSVYSNQGSILRFLTKAYLKVCTLKIHLL